ncbi:NUDIX domain-containing protein [Candidatus Uhrbacteria bacterium]|nr:NUDIX domain-containing protein [Candidatus Uhrbacteria bacterium]
MTDAAPRIRVGLGVMVFKDGKVLMGKRKGSHGEGEYAFPGGHIEFGESFEDCARREVREEAGIEINNLRFLRVMNLKAYPGKQYVDIGMVADWAFGEPTVCEPQKCEWWGWYDLDEFPSPQFATVQSYIESYRTGRVFFDA